MATVTSKRKKYVREVSSTWWKRLDFYKFYVLRESTAVPTLWFCLELFYGVVCLNNGKFDTKFCTFFTKSISGYFEYHHAWSGFAQQCNVFQNGTSNDEYYR